MEQVINIDKKYYNNNIKQTTQWLCEIFGTNKIEMNLNKQFANNVFFTILLLNNKPISVCRFILFDNRKTIFCSRRVLTIEKYRQKGYAKKVLNEGFLFLSKNYSCKKVISYIDKDNKASLILHKKAGYVKKEKKFKILYKKQICI